MKKSVNCFIGKHLLSLALTAFLLPCVPVAAAEEPVGMIVLLEDGFSAEAFAEAVERGIPGAEVEWVYGTLNGAAVRLPAASAALIASLDGVETCWESGSWEADGALTASLLPLSGGAVDPVSAEYANGASRLVGADRIAYTGKGTVVAVIDTGCDVTHPAFEPTASLSPVLTAKDVRAAFRTKALLASRYIGDPAETFVSEKIPFVFDYYDRDADVTASADHGTHVAGIVGAHATEFSDMQGIAPDCQLMILKIFDDTGRKATDQGLLAALEDALRLGADVVNLSLGHYAGSGRVGQINGIQLAFRRAEEAGCVIVCAAGNDGTTTSRSALALSDEIEGSPAFYTDTGTVSYPASASETLAVGSVESGLTFGQYFEAEGTEDRTFLFTDTTVESGVSDRSFAEQFGGEALTFAVVPGLGYEEDFAGVDVKGKLALIKRGEIPFIEKVTRAAEHGAVGAVVYDNNDEEELFGMDLTGAPIPAVGVSLADGEWLAEHEGCRLRFSADCLVRFDETAAGKPAASSSRGATTALTLKPELVGVGGTGVWSTINGGLYGSLDGTSMAAPQIAGACALLAEQLTGTERKTRSEEIREILMNTASPVMQENGTEASPRTVGAGLLNLPAALGRELSLTYAFNGEAKAELDDLIGTTMYLDAALENLTGRPLDVQIGVTMTHDGAELIKVGGKDVWYSTMTAEADRLSVVRTDGDGRNLNRYAPDYAPLALTLAPGEKRTVPLTVTLDRTLSEELGGIFTNGFFAEGYVVCETGAGRYAMPYLGYVGDWSAAPVLDAMVYEDDSVFGGSALYVPIDGMFIRTGANIFADEPEYVGAQNAFSPNDDGAADVVWFYAKFLRGVTSCEMNVTDAAGRVVYNAPTITDYQSKTHGDEEVDSFLFGWDGGDGGPTCFVLPDGVYTMNCTFMPDFDGAAAQHVSIPIVLDTEKPKLGGWEADRENGTLELTLSDDHALTFVRVYDKVGKDSFKRTEVIREDGTVKLSFDLGGFDGETLYCEAVDFAGNRLVERLTLAPEAGGSGA